MNKLLINKNKYINLAKHPITIGGTKIYTWASGNKEKPEIIYEYIEVSAAPFREYIQIPIGVEYLPEERENTILIVPLFMVNGIEKMVEKGIMEKRMDIRSPGKKVLGDKGKVLYADGLRCPSYM